MRAAEHLRCAAKFLDAVGKPIKQVTRGDVEQFLLAQARDQRQLLLQVDDN